MGWPAGADRLSIVLGGVNLRERRINPTSGVVQWRIVRQGQVPRRIGGNLVQSRRLVIAGKSVAHVAESVCPCPLPATPSCINPMEWEQEGL